MNILHIMSQLELTGTEVYVKYLTKIQKEQGHNVTVMSDTLHVTLDCDFISVPWSTKKKKERKTNQQLLKSFLNKHKIDVIHCHSRESVRNAHAVRKGVPLVTTLHGRQHSSWSKKIKDIYGEYIITVCKNIQLYHHLEFRTPLAKIKVVPNPIPLLQFPNTERINSPVELVCMGRSSGPKGRKFQQFFEQCGEWFFHTFPNSRIKLICANFQNFTPQFQEFFAQLQKQFPDRLIYIPHVENVSEIYAQCNLVIGAGRVALESLSCGLPTIALGEFTCHGLVTTDNLQDCLNSNFGDVGVYVKEENVDFEKLKQELLHLKKDDGIYYQPSEFIQNKIRETYDCYSVARQIETIYKAALFKRNVRRPFSVLMYHKILEKPSKSRHKIWITKEHFEKHLKFFQENNFTTMTFSELSDFWNLKKSYREFPKKPLFLTFDDGYWNNVEFGLPLLKKYGMKMTLFLLADHHILSNTWDQEDGVSPEIIMTKSQKQNLDLSVIDVGSHGMSHRSFLQLSEEDILSELKESKKVFEEMYGKTIACFAYPYGDTSEKIAKLCEQAGYDFAVNTDTGGRILSDEPFQIFRINMFPKETKMSLLKKTSWWYRLYYRYKRGK